MLGGFFGGYGVGHHVNMWVVSRIMECRIPPKILRLNPHLLRCNENRHTPHENQTEAVLRMGHPIPETAGDAGSRKPTCLLCGEAGLGTVNSIPIPNDPYANGGSYAAQSTNGFEADACTDKHQHRR